jgi:uncharacterized membrane protein
VAFCPTCGTQIADGTSCPKCAGGAAPGASAGAASTGAGLTDNVAGALAYLFIPAIVFLVLEPYNKNRFIRFHSFQCLFVCAALFAAGIALSILTFIPFLGLITIPLHFLLGIGSLVLWIILFLKAYQGQIFKLPVVGDMAAQQAGA